MKKILVVVIVFVSICILGILSVISVDYYVAKSGAKHIVSLEHADDADAVIILGARVFGDQVSYTLGARLEKGYEVYQSGKVKKIIVSGDHGQKEYNEVHAMQKYLMDKGVPKEDIFMDHAGFNTYDTMYRAKEIFLVKKAIVVTQKEHLLRALFIADKLDLDVQGVMSGQYTQYEYSVQRPREYLARMKAFLQCDILRSKPKFLGEAIPISGSGILTED